MQILKKIFFLLTKKEKKKAFFLLIIILIMAFFEMLGVASIIPFIAVLADQSIIENNLFLRTIYNNSHYFGIKNHNEFLLALGGTVFILLILSLIIKTLATYAQVRFTQMREFTIGKRLIQNYLHQPYSWFLNHHSADLGKTILSEVSQVVSGGLRPVVDIIAKSIVTIAITTLLIVVNPKLTLTIFFVIILFYGLVYKFSRNYLNLIGLKRLINNQKRFKKVNEAFNAFKEIKLIGLEDIYIKDFSNAAKSFARNNIISTLIAQLPRFVLEGVAIGGIILVILYLISYYGTFIKSLPLISLYVFACYRIMPALQSIYASFSRIVYISAAIDKIYMDLKNTEKFNNNYSDQKLLIKSEITLKNIFYSYPNATKRALQDISFQIPVKSTVGLVGSTGCGKTTTLDLLLGLLKPQAGVLQVDDKVISNQNMRLWQQSIGYVPQNIFLFDDTILNNIAFGKEIKDIDFDKVKKVSKIALLHDFVEKELPNQYATKIGENGIRLSGGQRQRIGIARALYRQPQLLVLDEATSALDNTTEKKVMENIYDLNQDMTIVIVAHRLNTIKNCDIIYKLHEGKYIERISYSKLTNLKNLI